MPIIWLGIFVPGQYFEVGVEEIFTTSEKSPLNWKYLF
jgi:hypothetical protein